MPIHEKIRLLRQAKGLTQEEVAERLNLSVNGYGKIERGSSSVNLARLEELANLFEVEPLELLGSVDRSVFNLSYTNNTDIHLDSQTNHNNSSFGNTEANAEIEKLQLLLQLKDKEIELREERIRHLTEMLEVLKASQPA